MRIKSVSSTLAVPAMLFSLALMVSFAAIPLASAADSADRDARFRTKLHGQPIAGVKPTGRAEFEREDRDDRNDNDGHRKRFSTEVDDVNLSNGTILEVDVDGAKVGTFKLEGGSGDLEVHGKKAPKVHRGSQVSVSMNGQTILTGTF